MSITLIIKDARVEERGVLFYVMHPANDAILAYCDTRKEAEALVAGIDRLARFHQLARATEALACGKCGDEPGGSPMPKLGEPCGRDLSEEVGHEPGTFICRGSYALRDTDSAPLGFEPDAESFVWVLDDERKGEVERKARVFFGQADDAPVRIVKRGPQTDDEKAKWRPNAMLCAVTITPKRRATPDSTHGTAGARR